MLLAKESRMKIPHSPGAVKVGILKVKDRGESDRISLEKIKIK
jgi:hypothetical protein